MDKDLSALITSWSKRALQLREACDPKHGCVLCIEAPQSLIWERLKTQIVADGIENGELIEIEIIDVRLSVRLK